MNLWPFGAAKTALMVYDHAAQVALVDAMAAQVPSPTSIPATQPATNSPEIPDSSTQEEIHMSVGSILSTIGGDLEKVVLAPITYITNLAKSAEPVVDKVFPGYANLYNSTVGAAVTIEAVFAAAGKQSGTGAQKLAYVVTAIEDEFNTYWTGLGNTTPAAVTTIETWVNNVLAGLELMQAPPATPAAPAAA